MPKIPTFQSRGTITTEAPSVTSNIQVSPTATPAAALLKPISQIAEYYEREKLIADKAEATKEYIQLSNELDEIETESGKIINPLEAQNTFQTQSKFLVKQKIDQIKNKRIKKMISDKFDIDIITRSNNVKKSSRGELEKQEEYNYDTEYQMNLSKYTLATGDEKNIYRNAILSNLESRSLYLNDNELTKQQSLDKVNVDLFDVDFNTLMDNKQFGSALATVKDLNNTKFLSSDQRIKYINKIESESQEYTNLENIKDAMLNKRAWGYDKKDKEKGIEALALSGQYNDTQIAELAIGSDVSYGLHKNVMTAGFSNAATTGNPTTVRAGYETYKMYKMQGGLAYLKSGMKLSDDQMDYYDTLDFMVDTMGMDIRSAMNDYGAYYKNKNNPDVKSIVADTSKVKSTAKDIADNFFTDDADNIDEIENLVKRYATILLKVRPSDQDGILDSVQKRIESNFRVDAFGNLTAIKPQRPETHDVAVKAYIKNLWDTGRINKQFTDFDDLIAVDVDPTSTTSISGIRIINKTFPTTPVIFKPAQGDFDENEFELGIFTDKQLKEVIYPFGSDARWEAWKDRQNARKLKQEMLQAEIIASKTGMLMPIEE
jgi:hypothetical protein